jgi:hypothetical protein
LYWILEAAVPFAGTAVFFVGFFKIYLVQFHKSLMLFEVCHIAATKWRPQ